MGTKNGAKVVVQIDGDTIIGADVPADEVTIDKVDAFDTLGWVMMPSNRRLIEKFILMIETTWTVIYVNSSSSLDKTLSKITVSFESSLLGYRTQKSH